MENTECGNIKFGVYCIYQLVWQNIPEDLVLHEHYCEDVKSQKWRMSLEGKILVN
jgi:hypothetical protein